MIGVQTTLGELATNRPIFNDFSLKMGGLALLALFFMVCECLPHVPKSKRPRLPRPVRIKGRRMKETPLGKELGKYQIQKKLDAGQFPPLPQRNQLKPVPSPSVSSSSLDRRQEPKQMSLTQDFALDGPSFQ